jgi:hypothetical protein
MASRVCCRLFDLSRVSWVVDRVRQTASTQRRNKTKHLCRIVLLAIPMIAVGQSSFAQVDSVFVKGDPDQCWLDVKEIVRRNSLAVTEDAKARTLYAEKYQTVQGGLFLTIHVDVAKGNGGEEGCRLRVTGNGNPKTIAHVNQSIATEVKKLQKKREKH